jgi:hypothetical protein
LFIAEVQREQAEAVRLLTTRFVTGQRFRELCISVTFYAEQCCSPTASGVTLYKLTLDQRGRLLDHARGLVALAIEVAQ